MHIVKNNRHNYKIEFSIKCLNGWYWYLCFQEDKGHKKSNLTSSSQFFSHLQDEVTAHISSKKAEKKRKNKLKNKSVSKFKL